MLKTKNQKFIDFISIISITAVIMLQIFFPSLKHNPSISIEKNLNTGVIKTANQTYFSDKILSTATIKIRDAGVFSTEFLTDNYLNGIVTLALQATFINIMILLLLRKPIKKTIIFSAITIFIFYGVGCIYTYRWFQINGIQLAQAGYGLVLPFGISLGNFILISWLLFYLSNQTRSFKNASD